MVAETDSHGRLYLTSDQRETYGQKFHVVEYVDRIELIPIAEDPLQAVREEIGGALKGMSREELQEEALKRGREEAEEDLEQARREIEEGIKQAGREDAGTAE